MNEVTLPALLAASATLGVVHTITGPDHYVPFIAMARVGRWSLRKTTVITLACGLGHVFSSLLIGSLGIWFGWALGRVRWLEGFRGDLAGWLLLGFGIAYLCWGLRYAYRRRTHSHVHAHPDGTVHCHAHGHTGRHTHVHTDEGEGGKQTAWILFTIFVFGPCEPLVVILMVPAIALDWWAVGLLVLVFASCTLITMLSIVLAGYMGLSSLRLRGIERYAHVLAGVAIAGCGIAMKLGY